ncbi:glycosyltransferase family 2 protein [Fistulina hepatica ATCC 64428]|uniref:chitin synthase n=1 Tax=Fistulina hepatica ATCC 64428 TaxID=1128425 RepID=A0A0D7AG90_9AGAR|nr:glycosyltransferase family 2 protein [Fistulina hepatica ATCC 64428]
MTVLRFQNNDEFTDVPIPTARMPTVTHTTTIRRAKTLTRPERSVAPIPLINPPAGGLSPSSNSDYNGSPAWRTASRIVTFYIPSFFLQSIGGLKDHSVQQAWREKMTLCTVILILCGITGFITVGFQKVFCPESAMNSDAYLSVGDEYGVLGVQGVVYNTTKSSNSEIATLEDASVGQDITGYFNRTASDFSECTSLSYKIATDDPCSDDSQCTFGLITEDSTFTTLDITKTSYISGYSWENVADLPYYFVIDGAVLNMTHYFTVHPSSISGDAVDEALRTVISSSPTSSGKDATRMFYSRSQLKEAIPCLKQRYYAGNIDKISAGCFLSDLVLYIGLIVILALVLVRFVMACIFNWFLSERLAGAPDDASLNRSAISPAVMPEGANISIDNRTGTAPWAGPDGQQRQFRAPRSVASSNATLTNADAASPTITLAQIGAELFAVCLVTCYSEGEDSLRTTLDSISRTTYSDARKLLFVIADGMVTGAGEKRSTPDVCISLLEPDERFGEPVAMLYGSIGTGQKAANRAKVYAGHYTVAGRRTPCVMVIKCGNEAEKNEKKPGNRGKRDSQLILMNFFSRVTYNDRMCPLDFDLFRKIQVLMGVTPDFFEVCLMVDADTKVFPSSLGHLVNCMHHDQMIMGVCGETRIANKRQTWVTAIQVYEYFISHHLAKAFESVFGGVTCLPGCFSMFRLKARRSTGEDWIPLIIKPEIVQEYSQSEVTTLHQKNLLLLGEDRFLTTILLRTFPNRKMMFLPQARCRTVVPDTFAMLLSQRRRWINSTIHNLMELVLVRDLCGTFCFSMQFVVFMDLIGTVVLPIAIALTYSLLINSILNHPTDFQEAIPLILLGAVLGLPAVLILITTRKIVYVFWMLIYLLALPIWNLVLPTYAFWHFDDFSWGETRKVEGEGKDTSHGEGGKGEPVEKLPLRRWEDWERSRLRKIRREEKRRREFERHFPAGYVTGESGMLSAGADGRSQFDGSDTISLASSDDDHWGGQIGGYNEYNAQYPPPPVGLHGPSQDVLLKAETLDSSELEAMLDTGFDDGRPSPTSGSPYSSPRYHPPDNPVSVQTGGGYSPLARGHAPPAPHVLSPTNSTVQLDRSGYVGPNRGGGQGGQLRYGPLGPLDPSSRY